MNKCTTCPTTIYSVTFRKYCDGCAAERRRLKGLKYSEKWKLGLVKAKPKPKIKTYADYLREAVKKPKKSVGNLPEFYLKGNSVVL